MLKKEREIGKDAVKRMEGRSGKMGRRSNERNNGKRKRDVMERKKR